jgi:microcystin-dependent protein
VSQIQVVNQGEEAFLDLITGVNMTLRLYRNDVNAGLTDAQKNALTEASFTEANFTGYAAIALTGGSWTTTQDDPSTASYAQQTFTRSSTGTAQLIYGYYLTKTTGGALQWYEQFDGPVSIEFINDALRITPFISLDEGSDVPTGQITAFGGASAPTGWLLCDGTAVSRTTYAALFAVLGTTYGAGNGTTTFNVPDLRQRFAMGKAASGTGATLGGTGGTVDHVHALNTSSSGALIRVANATNTIRTLLKTVASWTPTDSTNITASIANASVTSAAQLIGNSDTANPPFQTVNFIVKT